jgi:uncharacterized protein with beta-barrel porin domain
MLAGTPALAGGAGGAGGVYAIMGNGGNGGTSTDDGLFGVGIDGTSRQGFSTPVGIGATTAGAAGGTGGTQGNVGAGGGGGASGLVSMVAAGDLTGTLTGMAGGAGGNGGAGTVYSGGGGGGGGGGDIYIFGVGNVSNSGTVTGGAGGAGGSSGLGDPDFGLLGKNGSGGGGGAGLVFATDDITFTNTGTVTGGAGGARGSRPYAMVGTAGAGGAGVIASARMTILNSGTIAGGASPGGTSGNGITVPSGKLRLTNAATGIITGNIGVYNLDPSSSVITNAGTIGGVQAGIYLSNGQITNSGTITASSGSAVYTDNALTVFNNAGGLIQGATGITLNNASSVTNAGTITGTTNAIVFNQAGSTLTLDPGSVINGTITGTNGNTLVLGGSSGSATFDISQVSATGQYRTFTGFSKIDSSTWTLTGTSTYAGPININGGTLAVNGNVASASILNINSDGTLGGNGTVGSVMMYGGRLAPGNSIGMLNVAGSLTFASDSVYAVDVSPSNADRVNVTGAATLNGAAVNASFATGSYITKTYTILNAVGGVSGTFGAQVNTNLPSNFTSALSYDANNAYLNLTLNYVPPTTPSFGSGLSGNQSAVGNTLTGYFNRNGGIPLAFGSLTATGLTQASGETNVSAQQPGFTAATQFAGTLSDPTTAGRGATAPSAMGFAEDSDALAYASGDRKRAGGERDAYAMITKAVPRVQNFVPHWSSWVSGFGGMQTTDGNATSGTSTSTSRIAGAAIGADYWLSPQTVAGFAMAGGATSFSTAGGGGGQSDLFQVGGFVRHEIGTAYVSATAAYGWQSVRTDRMVGAEQLRAQFDTNSYTARLEGGDRFATPWLGGIALTPYAAAQVTYLDLPAYSETTVSSAGSFALAYAAHGIASPRTELGLRSDRSFAVSDALLTLRGRAAWAHDYNTERSASATFQSLPGASFVVNGATPAADAALTTAEAELRFAGGISVGATFEGEFSEVTRSYAGKGVVRYAW